MKTSLHKTRTKNNNLAYVLNALFSYTGIGRDSREPRQILLRVSMLLQYI